MRFPFLWIISERGLNRSQLNCMARINVSLADGMSCCLSDKRSLLKMHCLTVSTKIWVETIKACLRTGIIKKKKTFGFIELIWFAWHFFCTRKVRFTSIRQFACSLRSQNCRQPRLSWPDFSYFIVLQGKKHGITTGGRRREKPTCTFLIKIKAARRTFFSGHRKNLPSISLYTKLHFFCICYLVLYLVWSRLI